MSTAVAWKTWEGRVVDGKFVLGPMLGNSDHSAVFSTERSSQKAAIKLIPVEGKDGERQLSQWRAASQLSHPHLLHVFESGRCELNGSTYLYIVMECADEDLSQLIPYRALTQPEAADMLPPLLDALNYLHSKGFVQGRITPSNVMAVSEELKLAADHVASSAEINVAAKRHDVYDAPESAAGIVSPAGDMWSLGITLVTALTQSVPLSGEVSQRDAISPGKVPEPFRGIVRECLQMDPKRRCSVAEVRARLQPPGRSVPVAPEPEPVREARTKRGPIIAAAVVVAAIVGFFILHSRNQSSSSAAPEPSAQQSSSQPATPAASQPVPLQSAPKAQSQPAQPKSVQSQPAQSKPVQSKPAPIPEQPASKPAAPKPQPTTSDSVVRRVIPDVSRASRNTISGHIRVNVRVDVDSSGKVTNATLVNAGPSHYFANLALKSAQGWEFTPAEANGSPAASSWILHYRFGRSGTEVSADRASR
jgi:TonB family protein